MRTNKSKLSEIEITEPWEGIEEIVFGALGNAQGFEENGGNVRKFL
jgi:hypothetical protein